jgi:hypothetical protein
VPVAPTVFHHVGNIATRRAPCGQYAEQQHGYQRRERAKCNDPCVDTDLIQSREIGRRQHAKGARTAKRQRHAARAAGRAEHERLQHEVAHQSPTRRPQCGAHRQLALTRQVANEEQVREVGRANQ